ncbi:tyrosine-type recombinase/integrase [Nocardia vaccinii]|uniref:tyrosine-type recombinase/integrase n=1 Tax=Nocardia vaccinii TaxID=1822 RepID=UPI00082D4360|nr:tyrosine-type recombinase/integrase [Nocardia vaccinii]
MGKAILQPGQLGDIFYRRVTNTAGQATGWYAAGNWRRPTDGKILERGKTGRSKEAAKAALKKYIEALNTELLGSDQISPHTKIPVLADLWIAECEQDEGISTETVERYRAEINPSKPRLKKDGTPDQRYKPDMLTIKKQFENVSISEVSTPRYVLHEQAILAQGHRQKAKFHRIVMSGMMDLAVRHGAILPGQHPIACLKPIRSERGNPVVLLQEQLTALRAQLRAWQRGEEIPGTPAYTTGPHRDPHVVLVGDMLLATGARPGEALGFRRCDVHRPKKTGERWMIDILGTVKPAKTKGRKTYRQEYTKTGEDGKRTVYLPSFAVALLISLGAEDWADDDESPIFPDRNGNWRDPSNFRRSFRSARGDTFAHVVPKTFRATVATLIAEEYDAAQAGLQLGHRVGSKVTEEYYIAKKQLAPDSTPALDKFIGDAA